MILCQKQKSKQSIRQTAKQKFQKGDKVEMTKIGIKSAPYSHNSVRSYTGIVAGFSKTSTAVGIIRDKLKYIEVWHMDCWKKI